MLDYLFPSKVIAKEPILLKHFEIIYQNTDLLSLKFIHQEATVRVKDTVTDHYEISKKSFSLLLLMVTISTFLAGYLISKEKHVNNTGVSAVAFIALLICVFSILTLWQMNRPIKFRAPGRIPKKVMVKKIFENIISEDERYKYLLYQEILHCQSQIELNQYYNSHRLRVLDFIIRLVMVSFLTLLVIISILVVI